MAVLLLAGLPILSGCPTEGKFYTLDVDVAHTDAGDNPTHFLMADMGGDFACPPGQDGAVYIVDLAGNVTWEYDRGGTILEGVHSAEFNERKDQMMITDSCNNRFFVINFPDKTTLWESGPDCPELWAPFPTEAHFLGDGILEGTVLITSLTNGHAVLEIDASLCGNGIPGDEIVWQFGELGVPRSVEDIYNPTLLNGPHNGDPVPNGNVIISDSSPPYSRVIEVDYDTREIVWTYQKTEDCLLEGVPDELCVGLNWSRDADVECTDPLIDPECDTGIVHVMGAHQTVGVLRDLNEAPPPGEPWARGTTVPYRVQHGEILCYDSVRIPSWGGDDNGGLGYYLVSCHWPEDGRWLRIMPIDADWSFNDSIWELKTVMFPPSMLSPF
jgi:hypothetical protein